MARSCERAMARPPGRRQGTPPAGVLLVPPPPSLERTSRPFSGPFLTGGAAPTAGPRENLYDEEAQYEERGVHDNEPQAARSTSRRAEVAVAILSWRHWVRSPQGRSQNPMERHSAEVS